MRILEPSAGAIVGWTVAVALVAGLGAASAMGASAGRGDAYGRLPLQFEKNEGQTDRAVRYLARGNGYTLFLTPSEAVLAMRRTNANLAPAGVNLRMRLEGAIANPKLIAQDPLEGRVNYFAGNDRTKWRTGIGTWKSVRYQQAYAGIDLVFYGNQDRLEFDFVAAPGADPSAIRFRVDGAKATVDKDGDVILTAGDETVRMQKPVLYQTENGAERKPVGGRFVVGKSNEITFAVGNYDHGRALVIDPTLIYASYLGGTGDNLISGVAVNAKGEAFVTGHTAAANFPTTSGVIQALQPACAPSDCTQATGPDAFVAHISADGSQLLYSTYLGGNNEDAARAIAIDAAGDAYVTGYTFSNDFPLVNPLQTLCSPVGVQLPPVFPGEPFTLVAGCEAHPAGEPLVYVQGTPDVFITKLSPTGNQILYSTFFGGSGNDNATGIALDTLGNIYISGNTSSVYRPGDCCFPSSSPVAFPVTASAYQDGVHGNADANYFMAFVAKFSPDGQNMLYSTTFGGTPGITVAQEAGSMGLGQNGFVAIGGNVTSLTMPTKNAIQTSCAAQTTGGTFCNAGFLAGFDTTLSGDASLLFATYLGGSIPTGAGTYLYGVAVDGQNNVYATGNSQAHDFVSTPGTLHPGCTTSDTTRNCNDAFVLKTSSTGSLTWATNYGNGVSACPQITGYAITTDSKSNVYFAGNTQGCGVPLNNPFQSTAPGANAFVSTLSADGSTLLFGSLYGGSGTDIPYSIALDAAYNIYFGGSTTSTNLPGTAGSFQPNYAGGTENGFIAKVSPIYIASSTLLTANPNPTIVGQTVTLTATVTGQSGQPTPTGSVTFHNGAAILGTGSLNPSGVATYSTSSLAPGGYQLTAAYAGDNTYLSSSSGAVSFTVLATTTTALMSSLNPSTYGQSVTFTATVTSTAGTPTGYVHFLNGTASLAFVKLMNGSASLSTSALNAGAHTIAAHYIGSTQYAVSASTLTQTVHKVPTTTTITNASPNPSTYGQPVTFTATVSTTAGSAGGNVEFMRGALRLGSGTLSAGVASYTTTATQLPGGQDAITAVYQSDADHAGSTSAVYAQTVNKVATTTLLATSGSPSTHGNSVTFTATVSSSVGTPVGNVVFKDGTTVLGTVALSGGIAQLTTSTLAAGAHTIRAIYQGNFDYAFSSGTVKQLVQ